MAKMHILIIRFSSLGDIVLNSSLMEHLKEQYGENLKVSLLTSEMFSGLYKDHPHLDHLYAFNRSRGLSALKQLFELVAKIHQENPIDLLVDLHGTLRSIALRIRFFYLPRVVIDKRTFERSLLTTFKLNFLSLQGPKQFKRESAPHRFGELLLARTVQDFLGILAIKKVQAKALGRLSSTSFTFKDDEHFSLSKFSLHDTDHKKFICLVPSASFVEKRWSVERFYELASKVLLAEEFKGLKFIVLAGKEDHFCEIFNPLQAAMPDRFMNLQGKTSLVETTMLVKHSLFCVGNDTGVPHLAESVGTPSLFILGPTGEEFGFYPHLRDSELVMKRLWCRPCTTNGKGNCIRRERYCLTTIGVDEVYVKMVQMKKKLMGAISVA